MDKQSKKYDIKDKKVIVDLFVLWLALTALSCAAINLHISLNKLGKKEEQRRGVTCVKFYIFSEGCCVMELEYDKIKMILRWKLL